SSYHSIYKSLTNHIDIYSLNRIILDYDDDLINNDQQSIITNNNEYLEIEFYYNYYLNDQYQNERRIFK
ncbi:unnamed protein product, partial [Rotaria sp. Silwood2]